MNINSKQNLNDGTSIPRLGFGTWKILGEDAYNSVRWALDAGYRHIDTAQFYQNESEVGRAVRESGVKREDIYVTSKLQLSEFGRDRANAALDVSLQKLDIGYLDLFLLHWPVKDLYVETWNSLEKALKSDSLKSLGVSNFTEMHIDDLLSNSDLKPVVNQVELHPFLYQKELQKHCESHDIYIEAYSPLTQGDALNDHRFIEIADRYGKSVAQLLIRWSLQNGYIVLPKSSNQSRIQQNADVYDFEISEVDMSTINSFSMDKHYSWNPYKELQRKVFGSKLIDGLSKRK